MNIFKFLKRLFKRPERNTGVPKPDMTKYPVPPRTTSAKYTVTNETSRNNSNDGSNPVSDMIIYTQLNNSSDDTHSHDHSTNDSSSFDGYGGGSFGGGGAGGGWDSGGSSYDSGSSYDRGSSSSDW